MMAPRLHLAFRDAPYTFFQVDFLPLGVPELARPDKDVGSDQKGISGDEVASVVLDRSQKPAKLLGLENRCIVLCLWRDQRSAEHGRRVAFAARGGNAIPEYAARDRKSTRLNSSH